MKRIMSVFRVAALLLLTLCALPAHATTFQMNDYCVVPAFLNLNVPTNLLLMFDNSASSYDLEYTSPTGTCSNSPTTSCTTNANCSGSGICQNMFCYDGSYDNTKTYYGYFDPNTYYQSGGVPYGPGTCSVHTATSCTATTAAADCPSGETCVTNPNSDTNPSNTNFSQFSPVSALPGSCTFASSYMCLYLDNATAPTVFTFTGKGNFLNWLATSKLDMQKRIMTGGKYVSKTCTTAKTACSSDGDCPTGDTCSAAASNFLQGETRGCVGSRFVKEIRATDYTTQPTVSGTLQFLTFGVRGDISQDVRLPSQGGMGRIDIFRGANFNNAACQAAVTNWSTGGTGENATGSDTSVCLSVTASGSTPRTVWNHALQTCWSCDTSPCQPGSISNGDVARIEGNNECGSLTAAQMAALQLQPNDPLYVCLSDPARPSPNFSPNYSSISFHPPGGYLGVCVTSVDSNGRPNSWDDQCVRYQFASYCDSLQVGEVVDPSSGPQATGTLGNIPANMIDGGVTGQLGTPIRTYHVRATVPSSSATPTGLVQKYQGKIRMGAMTFDTYGSKSECTSTNPMILSTCTYANNQDGGKIISFMGNAGYCSATNTTLCYQNSDCPVGQTCNLAGDHTVGLINAIDKIRAATWTPFAEAYYNAIAYYVKGANTVSTLDATKYTPDTTSTTPSIRDYLSGSDSYAINKCSKSTGTSCSRTADCPSGEQCVSNPIQYKCQSNNILLVTDGSSTTDVNATMTAKVTDSSGYFRDPTTTAEAGTCGNFSGSPYVHDLSYFAKHRNIFTPSAKCNACSVHTSTTCSSNADCPSGETCNICEKAQTINTYVVYTGTAATAGLSGICDPQTQMQKTATNGGTTLYQASGYTNMYSAIDQALMAMAGGEASSTAASILSNSAGSGANILQAVFYPKKTFGNDAGGNPTSAGWIGEMLDLWYYVDPFINNSTMREDNNPDNTATTHYLDLKKNFVLTFSFDTNPAHSTYNQAVVQENYGNADGTAGAVVGSYVTPDQIQAIWRAGALLQAKPAGNRNIYTPCLSSATCVASGTGLMDFKTTPAANLSLLQPNLQASGTDSDAEAAKIVNWVRGTDLSGYRSRTVNNTNTGTYDVWKLGDIISSTPRIQSSVKLNLFDLPAPAGYKDPSYASFASTASNNYQKRGMAYVGANDGMLHAFKVGTLDVTASGTRKATLTGTNVGSEQWAFIPTNALPYLRYLTCVAGGGDTTYCNNQDYGHLYTVDGSTVVTDASIGTCGATHYWQCPKDDSAGTNWRTVLVGGMGVGGASKDNSGSCPDGNCVKSPIAGIGNSSYFALDVTNQTFNSSGNLADDSNNPNYPKFMWEFSDASIADSTKKGLGFATTGAAIVRVSARDGVDGLIGTPVKTNNGRWFAVFGSGPTGPIDTTSHSFLGTSNQNLKIYVVDLNATMPWTLGTNYWVIDSSITNAFVSSMSAAPIDTERWKKDAAGNYQDNALYFGYVQSDSGTTPAWTHGGILRLITGNDSTGENPDPSTWTLSKVITLNEPVTTGIARLQDRQNHNLWLYFGTGRYFYSQDDMLSSLAMSNSTLVEANRRHIYGIIEPCYPHSAADSLNMTCTTAAIDASDPTSSSANLADQSDISNPQSVTGKNGWFIELDAQSGASGAERSVTDAVAMTNGGVFFSTFKPTSDPCTMGGNSYLWAVSYNTGLAPPQAVLKGQVMFQLSTGEFKQVSLSESNIFSDKGGRRTGSNWTGKPPSDPPPIISTSNLKPVKKILHIQEK